MFGDKPLLESDLSKKNVEKGIYFKVFILQSQKICSGLSFLKSDRLFHNNKESHSAT